MANSNWLVVADRSGARIFEVDPPTSVLSLAQEILHPEGRLKNRAIDSDRPGRSFDRKGDGRHSMEPKQQPTEHLAERHAHEIARIVQRARQEHLFNVLFLVAPARFLGLLRSALDPATRASIGGSLDKDLTRVDERSLPKHIEAMLTG